MLRTNYKQSLNKNGDSRSTVVLRYSHDHSGPLACDFRCTVGIFIAAPSLPTVEDSKQDMPGMSKVELGAEMSIVRFLKNRPRTVSATLLYLYFS